MMDCIKRIELTRHRYAIRTAIAPALARASVRQDQDFARGQLYQTMMLSLYGRTTEEKRFEWPATWWDAVKLRWFPAWALKRWPAKKAGAVVDVKALYPSIVGRDEIHIMPVLECRPMDARVMSDLDLCQWAAGEQAPEMTPEECERRVRSAERERDYWQMVAREKWDVWMRGGL